MNAATTTSQKESARTLIDKNFEAALDAVHIKRSDLTPEKINRSKAFLYKQLDTFINKAPFNSESKLFDFANKAVINRLWLSEHGVTKKQFQSILIRTPHYIMLSKPERLQMNFEDGVDFLSAYGTKAAATKAMINEPTVWGMRNDTLRGRFEYSAKVMAKLGVSKETWGKSMLKSLVVLRKPSPDFYERFVSLNNLLAKHIPDQGNRVRIMQNYPEIFTYTPEKVESNITTISHAFADIGLTEEKFCDAALQSPKLILRNAETMIGNINTMIGWVEPYGPSRQECLTEILKQPSNIHANPAKLKKTFELIRILTQVPSLSATSGETKRCGRCLSTPVKHPAFERFYCLTWGEDNLLLRAAIAELLPHETKLTHVFSATRGKAEHMFVELLGHAPHEKEVAVSISTGGNMLPNKKTALELQNKTKAHANELRKAWHTNMGLTEDKRTPIKTNVLGTLLPLCSVKDMTPEEKRTLLERSIMSGLVKGYTLVAKP